MRTIKGFVGAAGFVLAGAIWACSGTEGSDLTDPEQGPPTERPRDDGGGGDMPGDGHGDAGGVATDAGGEDDGDGGADAGDAGDAGKDSGGGTGPGDGTPGTCRVTKPGGTGKEPGGEIPVCCTPSVSEQGEIDELFTQLNAYRVSKGLGTLTYDVKLTEAMQGHCEHMATHTFFAHDAPEASVAKFTTRASLCGASAFAENLGNGQANPTAMMTSWKNSPGHNTNMLGNYKTVGICRAKPYWGLILGR